MNRVLLIALCSLFCSAALALGENLGNEGSRQEVIHQHYGTHQEPYHGSNDGHLAPTFHSNTKVYQAPIDRLKLDESFLEASQISDSKCHLDYIKRLTTLVNYYSQFKPTFVPELRHFIKEQVQVCEPYFVEHLKGAVAQFSNFERQSISNLMECMAHAKQAFNAKHLHFSIPRHVLLEGLLSFLNIQAKKVYSTVTMSYSNYRQIFDDLVGGLCRKVELVLDRNPLIESYNLILRTSQHYSDEGMNPTYLDWVAIHRVCRNTLAATDPYRSKNRIDDEAFETLAERSSQN